MQTTASTSARRKCRVFLVSMPPPEAEFEGQELMPMLMTIPTKSPMSTQRFLELPHGATIHRAGPTSSAAVLFVCAGPCSRPRGSPLGFSARRCSPVSVPALTACSNPCARFFGRSFCTVNASFGKRLISFSAWKALVAVHNYFYRRDVALVRLWVALVRLWVYVDICMRGSGVSSSMWRCRVIFVAAGNVVCFFFFHTGTRSPARGKQRR